jgi:hypothetical protein
VLVTDGAVIVVARYGQYRQALQRHYCVYRLTLSAFAVIGVKKVLGKSYEYDARIETVVQEMHRRNGGVKCRRSSQALA